MTDHPNLIDPDRTVCLCGDGLPGYAAATAIAPDGTEHLLLVESASIGDERVRYDHTTAHARHEQPGPLPDGVQHRVWQVSAHRCGRPTKSGAPCRTPVARVGYACSRHRAKAAQ